MIRVLYQGSIPVAGNDLDIADPDQRVTRHPILRFRLDYPFERPYDGEVISDAGASLRQIVDAIHAAYRRIYRGTSCEQHPRLDNKRVRGDHGEALHVIEDLVIEQIAVDDETGVLEIFIGS